MSVSRSVFCCCESGGGSDERSDVPLTALTFLHVRKACQKIVEEFEDLFKVRFVNFEGAIQSGPVSLIQVEIKPIEVWNAAIHTLDHSVLKLDKSRVVEWDPDVTDEGGSRVVSHGPKMKLKFVRL